MKTAFILGINYFHCLDGRYLGRRILNHSFSGCSFLDGRCLGWRRLDGRLLARRYLGS